VPFAPFCGKILPVKLQPAIYEHAARLIGKTPWEVSRDGNLLREAHAQAYRTYQHIPIVVGIDIYNIEAEAYGAVLEAPHGNAVPTFATHPCPGIESITKLPPLDPDSGGRLPMTLEAATALKRMFPEAQVRVPVCGPFSLASHLVGFENLLVAASEEPEHLQAALDFLTDGEVRFCRRIAERGFHPILFESAAVPPLISPRAFRDLIQPSLRRILDETRQRTGQPAACIIGGNSLPILDDLLAISPGFLICPSETDQAPFMQKMEKHPEIGVRISVSPSLFL
jgi:uroporphyrinogen decarboxylase